MDAAREAVATVGQDLDALLEQEEEPGLGNGGLGRLAACYMDSLATLKVPAIGYGIRYEFGIFDQAIRDGWQVELTDKWLRFGNPWEIVRPEITFDVKFGGRTERVSRRRRATTGSAGSRRASSRASPTTRRCPATACPTANLLRLWKAEAAESFDFEAFNVGDYYGAVDEKVASETSPRCSIRTTSRRPASSCGSQQQYFFVSCSLQDMIRLHLMRGKRLDEFDACWAAQLNDTHPSIAVAELMRLLVDEHLMDGTGLGDHAADLRLHEPHAAARSAREWPLPLFGALLPRHLEIIYEINRRFLDDVRRGYPGDDQLRRRAVADRRDRRPLRAHGAPRRVGSHAINGVAALHTELLKQTVLRDFHELSRRSSST